MQPLYKQEAAEIDLGWIQNSNCCNVYCMVFFPSLFSQLFFFCKCNHGLNAHTAHVEISKLREFSVSFLLFHPKSMKSFKTFVFFCYQSDVLTILLPPIMSSTHKKPHLCMAILLSDWIGFNTNSKQTFTHKRTHQVVCLSREKSIKWKITKQSVSPL